MPMVGNKVVGKDIRAELVRRNFNARSAKISNVELVAIQRPGWLQVFSFELRAFEVDREESVSQFGLCRDDESAKTFELQLFDTQGDRTAVLDEWSIGMIRRDRGRRPGGHQTISRGVMLGLMLVLAIVFLLVFAAIANGR